MPIQISCDGVYTLQPLNTAFFGARTQSPATTAKPPASVQFGGDASGAGDRFERRTPSPELARMKQTRQAAELMLIRLRDELMTEKPDDRRLTEVADFLGNLSEKLYNPPELTEREAKHEASKHQILAARMEDIAEQLNSGMPHGLVLAELESIVGPAINEDAALKRPADTPQQADPLESVTPAEVNTAFWEVIGQGLGDERISEDAEALNALEQGLSVKERHMAPLRAGISVLEDTQEKIAMATLEGGTLSDKKRQELGETLMLAGATIEDHAELQDPALYRWDEKKLDMAWFMKDCGRELSNPDHPLELISTRLSHWIPRRKAQWGIKTFDL